MNNKNMQRLFAVAAVWLAPCVFAQVPTPTPNEKVRALEKQVEEAEKQLQEAKAAWEKARLETQLYYERYQRAYREWVESREKPAAVRGKLRAKYEHREREWRLAGERRRRLWYLYEAARFRAKAEENALEAERHLQGAQRTALRIQEMEKELSETSGAP